MPSHPTPPQNPEDFRIWCVECRARIDGRLEAQADWNKRMEAEHHEIDLEIKYMKKELTNMKIAMAKWAGAGGFAGAALVMLGQEAVRKLFGG